MKALAAFVVVFMGARVAARAAAYAPDLDVAAGAITPAMPVTLTRDVTFTYRFNSSSRFILETTEVDRQSLSSFLTKLVNIDGVRIVAEKRQRNRQEILVARRYFQADSAFRPFISLGINRGRYLDPSTSCLGCTASGQARRSFGLMAEAGAAWRITPHLEMNADVHWFASNKVGRLMSTDAGWVSAEPIVLTLSLVWRFH